MFVDGGFGAQLLCSVASFRDRGERHVALVYLYKRGTFYPFAPLAGKTRNNALELTFKDALEGKLPIEEDLHCWFPVWDAPGLELVGFLAGGFGFGLAAAALQGPRQDGQADGQIGRYLIRVGGDQFRNMATDCLAGASAIVARPSRRYRLPRLLRAAACPGRYCFGLSLRSCPNKATASFRGSQGIGGLAYLDQVDAQGVQRAGQAGTGIAAFGGGEVPVDGDGFFLARQRVGRAVRAAYRLASVVRARRSRTRTAPAARRRPPVGGDGFLGGRQRVRGTAQPLVPVSEVGDGRGQSGGKRPGSAATS